MYNGGIWALELHLLLLLLVWLDADNTITCHSWPNGYLHFLSLDFRQDENTGFVPYVKKGSACDRDNVGHLLVFVRVPTG